MSGSQERFVTTHWSMIAAASEETPTRDARLALTELCQMYWAPLYAFARRSGHQPADAQDLTQAFFANLLDSPTLDHADAERGRFRTYLLTAFRRFATSQWRKQTAEKRGGGAIHFPLDFERLEASRPQATETPEMAFQRRWAVTVLENVVSELEREYESRGKQAMFERLRGLLVPNGETADYATIAATLGTSEGAVKVAAHRIKQRYREILRRQIAETVTAPQEVDDELHALMNSFRKSS